MNMVYVAKRFPKEKRVYELSFEHYRLLAPISERAPETFQQIASRSQEKGLTTSAMKVWIPKAAPKPPAPAPEPAPEPTPEELLAREEHARNLAGNEAALNAFKAALVLNDYLKQGNGPAFETNPATGYLKFIGPSEWSALLGELHHGICALRNEIDQDEATRATLTAETESPALPL